MPAITPLLRFLLLYVSAFQFKMTLQASDWSILAILTDYFERLGGRSRFPQARFCRQLVHLNLSCCDIINQTWKTCGRHCSFRHITFIRETGSLLNRFTIVHQIVKIIESVNFNHFPRFSCFHIPLPALDLFISLYLGKCCVPPDRDELTASAFEISSLQLVNRGKKCFLRAKCAAAKLALLHLVPPGWACVRARVFECACCLFSFPVTKLNPVGKAAAHR